MVLCIAGHVGHGKTTLVKTLTGIDTDQLSEEKKHNLTIKLDFVPSAADCESQISLIELSNHKQFSEYMLCNTSGCEGALLCIDLCEGFTPDTLEYLQIVSLLKIKTFICVFTKKDLVDDSLINQRQNEFNLLLKEYGYINTPVIVVSTKTEEGISVLYDLLTHLPSKEWSYNEDWFLPIDRVWISKEKGVIITGTLQGGVLKIKDKGLLMPKKEEAWVRGLEENGAKREIAHLMTRVTVMLGKREGRSLKRGDIFCKLGVIDNSDCLDGEIIWLKVPKHASRVRICLGTKEIGGKVILIPNQEKIAQFHLDSKIGVKKNMSFIIRDERSLELLGGGEILIANSIKRRIVDRGIGIGRDLSEDLLHLLQYCALPGEILRKRVGATLQEFSGAIELLKNREQVVGFADVWYESSMFKDEVKLFIDYLTQFHDENPSIIGAKRDEVIKTTGLNWKGNVLDEIIRHLKNQNQIKVKGKEIALTSFNPQINPKQQIILDKVKSELERSGLETPYPTTIAQNLGIPLQALEGILRIGKDVGQIMLLPQGIYYTKFQFESILTILENVNPEGFSIGDFKEALGTSRKYALAILEYCDTSEITVRVGDIRVKKGKEATDLK